MLRPDMEQQNCNSPRTSKKTVHGLYIYIYVYNRLAFRILLYTALYYYLLLLLLLLLLITAVLSVIIITVIIIIIIICNAILFSWLCCEES